MRLLLYYKNPSFFIFFGEGIDIIDAIAFILAFFGTPLALIGINSEESNKQFVFLFSIAVGWAILHVISAMQRDNRKRVTRKSQAYRPIKQTPEDSPQGLNPITTKIVGVTFEGRQSIVAKLHNGERLQLIQEPENPYDSNAVKVVRENGQQVGYINRDLAKEIEWHFQASINPRYAKIVKITGDPRKGKSLGVIIQIPQPTVEEAIVSDMMSRGF